MSPGPLEQQSSEKLIEDTLKEAIRIKTQILEGDVLLIVEMAKMITSCLRQGGKVLFAGNGGSAADSQHLAAELVGRFQRERAAMPAIALTTNTSILSAIANDYGYDTVFSRQIEALATEKDVLVALSTSGASVNILKAISAASAKGVRSIGLTGRHGKAMKDACDLCLMVPSSSTARIQEVHITVGHILCDLVERQFAPENSWK